MDYVLLQIVTAIIVFISLITFSYLPYCIIQHRDRTRSNVPSRRKSSIPILSLCNCFAAGVFLATCFLGMVPHVRQQVVQWMEHKQLDVSENASIATSHNLEQGSIHNSHHGKHTIPWTEVLLMSGFLMILVLEEVINMCRRYCVCCHGRRGYHGPVTGETSRTTRLQTGAEDEPLMSDSECCSPVLGEVDHRRGGSIGKDQKSASGSSVDLVRMSEMGSPIRPRTPNPTSHEHHHHHHHHMDASLLLTPGGRSLSWRSVALLLGLGIHGVFEGIALGLQDTSESLFGLLFGVMSHEALCAMAFGINLASHRVSIGVAFLTTVLFSLTIPFGMAAGTVVNRHHTNGGGGEIVRITLEGLAAGTFVYVSFMDMLAHELGGGHGHDGNEKPDGWRMVKVLCVCAGFFLFWGVTLLT